MLLYGYWFAMTVLPVPDSGAMGQLMLGSASQTMAAWWDRLLLDWTRFGLGNHLWVSSQTWDPEGPFSTIPAIGTAMLGNLAGQWIASKRPLGERLNGLFGAGAIAMMVAMMWNWSFPINKSLWTSSYVLFCGGMAAVGIATSMWVIDVHGSTSVIVGVAEVVTASTTVRSASRTQGFAVMVTVYDRRRSRSFRPS